MKSMLVDIGYGYQISIQNKWMKIMKKNKDKRRRMIWQALYKPVDNNKKEEENEPIK